MSCTVVTAYYRATIPQSVGRVRTVDSEFTFTAYPAAEQSVVERLNTLRLLARQRVAELHGISPLLVVIRDISTDAISESEMEHAE